MRIIGREPQGGSGERNGGQWREHDNEQPFVGALTAQLNKAPQHVLPGSGPVASRRDGYGFNEDCEFYGWCDPI